MKVRLFLCGVFSMQGTPKPTFFFHCDTKICLSLPHWDLVAKCNLNAHAMTSFRPRPSTVQNPLKQCQKQKPSIQRTTFYHFFYGWSSARAGHSYHLLKQSSLIVGRSDFATLKSGASMAITDAVTGRCKRAFWGILTHSHYYNT